MSAPLRVARLGTVPYRDALALQEHLHERAGEQWLLLLEHPHVYTLGVRARPEHVLIDPASVGADIVRVERGGDVTYHGPGQLVGYPIVDVAPTPRAIPAHVAAIEDVLLRAVIDLGLRGASRRVGYPGVWIEDRKIAAVGVRITGGRSLHGFAVNVDPDLAMFTHIVPCGLRGVRVTSLAAEGIDATIDGVAEAIEQHAARQWGDGVIVSAPALGARC